MIASLQLPAPPPPPGVYPAYHIGEHQHQAESHRSHTLAHVIAVYFQIQPHAHRTGLSGGCGFRSVAPQHGHFLSHIARPLRRAPVGNPSRPCERFTTRGPVENHSLPVPPGPGCLIRPTTAANIDKRVHRVTLRPLNHSPSGKDLPNPGMLFSPCPNHILSIIASRYGRMSIFETRRILARAATRLCPKHLDENPLPLQVRQCRLHVG